MKYIGFYDLLDSELKRTASLAAINKMNYIANVLYNVAGDVEIVSPSWYIEKKGKVTRKIAQKLDNKINIILSPSFCTSIRALSFFRPMVSKIWLLFYLVINIKKNEEIIVYHSLSLIRVIKWARKIKKFRIILEVEEIYADVVNVRKHTRNQELMFLKSADKYIFPTELLNEKINTDYKPYAIIYGTYQVELEKEDKFCDGKTHVVYAGTFAPSKGATTAIEIAKFLDNKYHVHIIGFGSEVEKNHLINKINNTSNITDCNVTYDGLLRGDDYIRFIQRCHIGLSTQMPEAIYNDTSFPSKVLSYMANGLRVVSVKIKSLERAKIGHLLWFCENNSPQLLAKVIKEIDIEKKYNSRHIIKELDKEFHIQLKELLEK